MQKCFWLAFIFCKVWVVNVFSQGVLSGVITDSKTNEPLIGVVVKIENTTLGAVSGIDGSYKIEGISIGKHTVMVTYIGYATKAIKQVEIKNGQTTTIHAQLEEAATQIKEVDIVATKTRATESAVVAAMRKETGIVSGISAAQISKGQDRNAAEVVKRIPGVSIQEGRFVNIRGLKERYNCVWINDAAAPSSETDRRAFSFDIIPAGMLERIMVHKTPSPELPGDFAGGMVKIYTQSIPEKNSVSAGYSVSFREGSTFKPIYTTQGSKTELLGFDNGYRAMPSGIPEYISKNSENITAITKSFKNNWALSPVKAMPDMRANIALQGVLRKKGVTLGSTTAITYSITASRFNINRADYDSATQISAPTDTVSTKQVNVGVMQNMALRFKNHQIDIKLLLNQTGREQNTMRGNFINGINDRFFAEYYQARTIVTGQLMGSHKFREHKTQYEWSGSYSFSSKKEPDFKRIRYSMTPDSLWKAPIANVVDPVNGGGRFFSELRENSFSFNQTLRNEINVNDYTFHLSVGNYVEYKWRTFSTRILGYTIQPGADAFYLTRLPLDTIFSPANTGESTKFKLDEITGKSDRYKAQNLQTASYVCANLPIGSRVKLITGLRYEYNKQSLQSFLNLDSIGLAVVTHFVLPSANLSINVHKNMLLRFVYGKTVNRPEFREWSPFFFYDFEFNAGNYGSLFPTVFYPKGEVLKVAQIHNADVRFEWYPEHGDMIHVGAFFKHFKDPIQQVITPTGGSDSKGFTFINGTKAIVYGAELDVRKNLGFITPNLPRGIMNHFSLVFNAAYINSHVTLPNLTNLVSTTKLQGQSPYIVNAGLYFQHDSLGLQASLLYNVYGARVYAIGNIAYGSIGEMEKHTLDFSVSKTFFKRLTVTFSIQDLINQANRLVLDIDRNNKFESNGADREIMHYKNGRYYSLGVKFKL